jgi:hypothetical protein
MARSFDLVDFKVAEAEFFLSHISECGPDFFAVQCHVSAFLSSTRSITYAIQACLKNIEQFADWYKTIQEKVKTDSLSKFFHKFRNVNQHIGENVVRVGAMTSGKCIYWFSPVADLQTVPEQNVESACRAYFLTILSVVYDCYKDFGPHIDPKQHYTQEHFARIGKTIEDAEEELFGIRGWSKVPGYPEAYRWQALRDSQPGCGINHIFSEYLGKMLPEPARLPDLPPLEDEGWYQMGNGGRVWIPLESRISDDPMECLEHFRKTIENKNNEER